MVSYMEENARLETLAQALAIVADEFARTRESETAVCGYVLAGLVLRAIEAADEALESALDQ